MSRIAELNFHNYTLQRLIIQRAPFANRSSGPETVFPFWRFAHAYASKCPTLLLIKKDLAMQWKTFPCNNLQGAARNCTDVANAQRPLQRYKTVLIS